MKISYKLTESQLTDLLKEVKILLEIGGVEEDTLQDPLISKIISNTHQYLYGLLRLVDKEIETVPSELSYIIEEIAVRRYNRVGSEGLKSDRVEEHHVTFFDLDKEFYPYMIIINGYADDKAEQKVGRVLLF